MVRIISVTELRKNFGEITSELPKVEKIILTRGGKPFATLKATPEEKRKLMRKTAGALKGTSLDDDKIWKEVFKRKSRKKPITF